MASQPADHRRRYTNLADARLGAVAMSATDEFFGARERLLAASEPQWREGVYDEHGKWMDGWETRRRRGPGHDACVIRLAAPGRLSLLQIDTRYFTGNYPPHVSVDACHLSSDPDEQTSWDALLPVSALTGNHQHEFAVNSEAVWTHLRLNLFPDGGVARLRAYGTVQIATRVGASLDLAAALGGGLALACSDEHYGAMGNLLLPGRGTGMADGWETRRRREPGHDWVILALGQAGRIERVEIDTAYFKGNFPHQVSINAALLDEDGRADAISSSLFWPVLMEPQRLAADQIQAFSAQVRALGPVSHVRVNVHPDGGISRIRLFGTPEAASSR